MHRINDKLISWASIAADNAIEQAEQAASMPFVYKYLSLMPDCHWGAGSTIGSVIPTQGAIIPAAVGVDIGCGMSAVRTMLRREHLTREELLAFRDLVAKVVPMGFACNQKYNDRTEVEAQRLRDLATFDPASIHDNWDMQIGSLGGGNHFIELSYDQHDRVWLTIHTGSRGIGKRLADVAMKTAKLLCKKETLPNPHLAYLVAGTPEFDAYVAELLWAQEYARANRDEIVARLLGAFSKTFGMSAYDLRFDCHHNYAEVEEHFGERVWVTRKGAVRARVGDVALIPGSMGTPSYVVEGKGNPLSFDSAPHGAGRTMGRKVAFETLDLDEQRRAMEGIVWGDDPKLLDETPAAYKDIDVVIADAADLIEVKHTLRPILNIKGV